MTKIGYAVQLPTGEYRGVYRTRKIAAEIMVLASVSECVFGPMPTIERVRIPYWRRYGLHALPGNPQDDLGFFVGMMTGLTLMAVLAVSFLLASR